MPYRPLEYVPQQHRPNDSRLSDLLYARNQIEVNRLQNQGVNDALMWRGIGNAATGVLGDLAQYKREEPARKEAERVRNEQAKLRGLEQMAGAGGMDEEARGKLLKQEGFAEKGQEILDKDMTRKATKATYDDANRKRALEEMADVSFKLDEAIKDPAGDGSWPMRRAELLKQYGDRVKDLPEAYDKAAIDAYMKRIDTATTMAQRNARAKAATDELTNKKNSFETHVKNAQTMFDELASLANEPDEWEKMWSQFDAYTADFTPEERKQLEARMNVPRTFSPEAHRRAEELARGPQKDPASDTAMALQIYQRRHPGSKGPTTPAETAEFNKIRREQELATHIATGRGGTMTRSDITGIERWRTNALLDLEGKRVSEQLTDDEYEARRRVIDQGYEDQMGGATGGRVQPIVIDGNEFDTPEAAKQYNDAKAKLLANRLKQSSGNDLRPQTTHPAPPPTPALPPSTPVGAPSLRIPQNMPPAREMGRMIPYTNGKETMNRYEGEADNLRRHGWYPMPRSLADTMRTRSGR